MPAAWLLRYQMPGNRGKAMARTAIAYVSDVILGRTGEVIGRAAQKEAIRQHADASGIEIVAWFEDEAYDEEILTREGIRSLLTSGTRCDCVLVERVWSLSRNWKLLEAFLGELGQRGMRLEAATMLWDCTSQRARHFHSDRRPRKARVPRPDIVTAAARVRIKKPERLFFTDLVHRPARA
jgi:DNA invertase Pin-like site-specific DNA recombinase